MGLARFVRPLVALLPALAAHVRHLEMVVEVSLAPPRFARLDIRQPHGAEHVGVPLSLNAQRFGFGGLLFRHDAGVEVPVNAFDGEASGFRLCLA